MCNLAQQAAEKIGRTRAQAGEIFLTLLHPGRGVLPYILGHIRDVRPEWVTFPGRKLADGCTFFTKNLRIGHNFDIICKWVVFL